jgi:hypothetical protein
MSVDGSFAVQVKMASVKLSVDGSFACQVKFPARIQLQGRQIPLGFVGSKGVHYKFVSI